MEDSWGLTVWKARREATGNCAVSVEVEVPRLKGPWCHKAGAEFLKWVQVSLLMTVHPNAAKTPTNFEMLVPLDFHQRQQQAKSGAGQSLGDTLCVLYKPFGAQMIMSPRCLTMTFTQLDFGFAFIWFCSGFSLLEWESILTCLFFYFIETHSYETIFLKKHPIF